MLELFEADLHSQRLGADRVFAVLLSAQLVLAIGLVLVKSPYTYAGAARSLHPHVLLALGGGLVINAVPLLLLRSRPGWIGTRHAVAIAQMLWSALFIHFSGGRIEVHFHVFASLAALSMYRDPWLLVTATVIVASDHLARGVLAPVSIYGVPRPEWWRFLEHASWVALEDAALIFTTHKSLGETRRAAAGESEQARIEHLVSERTRELSDSREQYRALVETTQVLAWEVDALSLKLVYIGPQCRRMLGVDPELGVADPQAMSGWIHPDDLERVVASLRTALSGGNSFEIECRMRNAQDQRVLFTRSVGTVVVEGESAVIRGLTFDVTERKKLELELAQAHKLESIGRLASGIAHEINTPIQYISDNVFFLDESFKGMSEVLDAQRRALALLDLPLGARKEIEAAEAAAELDFLRANVPSALSAAAEGLERVSSIVRSMKEFANQDAGEPSFVDLNQSVLSTITVARSEYKYVAELITEAGEIPLVRCLPTEINRVVLHLVVNAAHAIEARGPQRGLITVRTWRDGDHHVCISVSDTGTGIDAAVSDRIFDPFFTTKAVGQGTGQGLSIARSVVDRHGGTIAVDSEPGRGAVFTVRLPIDMSGQKAA